MIVYICTYLLSLYSLSLDFRTSAKVKYSLYFILLLLLICIATLKNEGTSPDTINYINSFERAIDLSQFSEIDNFYFEPGYVLLESIISYLGFNYTVLFFIVACISISIYGFIFWKYSPYPFLSLFIFISIAYITQIVVIIRYGLATSIILLSLMNYIHAQYKRFIVLCIIASFFHYTSLTCILLFPFFLVKNKIKVIVFLIIIGGILILVNISILDIVLLVSNFLPNYFQYALSKGTQYLEIQGSSGFKQILLYLPVFYFVSKVTSYSKSFKSSFFVFLFAMFLMLEFAQAEDFARINKMYLSIIYYFFPLLLTLLPKPFFGLFYKYIIVYCLYMFLRISFFNSGIFINVI